MSIEYEEIEKCRHLAEAIAGPRTTIYAMKVIRDGELPAKAFTGGVYRGDFDDPKPMLLSVDLSLVPELARRHPEASHLHFIVPDETNPESARASFEDEPAAPHRNSLPVELHAIEVPDAVFDSTLRIDEDFEPIVGPLADLYEAIWKLDGYLLGEGLYGEFNNTYYDCESYGPDDSFVACIYAGEIGGAGRLFFYTTQSLWVQ